RVRSARARGVRHVRHHLRGSSGPHAHPDARGLGGLPAAQGLRHGPHPGAVQGSRKGCAVTATHEDPALTSEGAQELAPRSTESAVQVLMESGAVLRLSEAAAAELADAEVAPGEDETMIINMGPQHPSTHGVLRLMLELQGETVIRTKPIIGYLHTGMEKQGEELSYLQGQTNTTRMDYASPFFNELVFCMAAECLLEVELPPRAQWIRTLMCELNRISSHLLFLATNGMDIGAVSMMLYGW